MIRTWISSFIRKNKTKILKIFKGIGLIILISTAAGMLFSQMLKSENSTVDSNKIYVPNKTVISGENVKQEEFKEQDNLVKTFVNYCNEQKFEEAYNLWTEECKQKEFPTYEKFKNNYCQTIFSDKRNYNMQSWVNEKGYNTYRVYFTEDIISTGNYSGVQKFEDYITIVTDEENNRKLNIKGYVKTKEINKTTTTDELEIKVAKVDIYIPYERYYINIKNKTDKNILLDNLKDNSTVKLVGDSNVTYKFNDINLFTTNLHVDANNEKDIELTFNKQYESHIKGLNIEFRKVIMDYLEYSQDIENYNGYRKVTVKL